MDTAAEFKIQYVSGMVDHRSCRISLYHKERETGKYRMKREIGEEKQAGDSLKEKKFYLQTY